MFAKLLNYSHTYKFYAPNSLIVIDMSTTILYYDLLVKTIWMSLITLK